MRALTRGLFQNNWQPHLQCIRNKTKVNVTKPRLPHFERALTEHVCRPYFVQKRKPKHIPDFDACAGGIRYAVPNEDHPLKTILANENLDWFKRSKLIAFFHLNAINPDEKFQCQLLMKRKGLKLLFFNKPILDKALSDTVFENVLHLYKAPTATAFSQEPDLHELLGIVKKLPKLVLMGAIVENRFLSLTEIQKYGKFENIDAARTSLLYTLRTTPQTVVQHLNHHPTMLVEMLNQHKRILEN